MPDPVYTYLKYKSVVDKYFADNSFKSARANFVLHTVKRCQLLLSNTNDSFNIIC